MKSQRTTLFIILIIITLAACTKNDKDRKQNSGIEPIPFTQVTINDAFWAPKIKTNYEVTIPIAINQCYSSGRVDNFKIAGGLMEGKYQTDYPFDDTDIYKLIEAASYSLQNFPDPALESRLDTLIHFIAKAQEPDGYLFTSRTIDPQNPHPWADSTRWTAAAKGFYGSHELYNCGHLYEAAVAHYAATGKKTLLNVAIKNADLLVKDFGPGKLEFGPGHQIVEMGLIRLYHTTGKKDYLQLAKFFLDVRGPDGEEYCQAHQKVTDQTEPVGHSVRATYMYSAMADIAALYNDSSYLHALTTIWSDLVNKKTYITGGIGSGGGNEGFDAAYELPNMSAYCETCASVGNIFWNKRMFLYDGDAKYYDMLEKTLYNSFLSGVSLSGDRFFYPNVLESMGQHKRSAWFGCACCPPNVARLLPSLPGYIYAQKENEVYVNLFIGSEANLAIQGDSIHLLQETNFPWDGNVNLKLITKKEIPITLKIRIPHWAQEKVLPGDLYAFVDQKETEYSIILNGKPVQYNLDKGYAVINRKWKPEDNLHIVFPMEPQPVVANDSVKADRGKFSIQRGPIVYVAEWADVKNGKVLNLIFEKNQEFKTEYKTDFLSGVSIVNAKARAAVANQNGDVEYQEVQEIQLIPYYSWNNRGPGEMMVWLPYNENSIRPLPYPSIASTSKVSCSVPASALIAVNDQLLPTSSNDHQFPFTHWYPLNDTTIWVQYDFVKQEKITSSKIYWFDDGPFGGCRIPQDWEIRYKSGNLWLPIKTTSSYTLSKDDWDKVDFEPIKTSALRLYIELPKNYSTGLHEWVVK